MMLCLHINLENHVTHRSEQAPFLSVIILKLLHVVMFTFFAPIFSFSSFSSSGVFADLVHLSHVQTFGKHSQSFDSFTIEGVPYLAMAMMYNSHQGTMCVDSIIYKWNETQKLFVEEGQIEINESFQERFLNLSPC